MHSNIYHRMKTGKHIERRKGGVFVYIPVNNVERVQISQRAGHLSNVEFCPRLWESPFFLEVEEELKRKCAYPKGEKTLILINFYPYFSDFDHLTQFGERSRDRGGGPLTSPPLMKSNTKYNLSAVWKE